MKKKHEIIFIVIIMTVCMNFTMYNHALNNFFIETCNIYEKSKKKLQENNFNDAISMLEKIKNNVLNFNNDKIQMGLIYSYYKTQNWNSCQKNIEEFIYLYPNHPNIDYVIYIQALTNIEIDKNNFLGINYHKNDLIYAVNAFFQLKNLISQYPKSNYIINAKKNLISLKLRLSEYDFQILKFYFLKNEYIAVINRGEEIIKNYPETPVARKTLLYMEKSFFALKIFDTAKKISKIIELNNN